MNTLETLIAEWEDWIQAWKEMTGSQGPLDSTLIRLATESIAALRAQADQQAHRQVQCVRVHGAGEGAPTERDTDMTKENEMSEREQFEEVHCGNNPHLTRKNSTTDEYVLPSINDAWAGWQAAIESQAAELAQAREKHFEECIQLCRPLGSMVDDQFNKGYLHGCAECANAISRAAAKEQK